MAFIRCMGGNGGSGSTIPAFDETVILDNSSEETSFTFDEDYHDYDILRFKVHNVSSDVYSYYFCTPSGIDHAFLKASRVTFNELNTNQYATYSQSDLTWTRTNSRNIHVVECVGLTCNNMTVNEVELYKASSISSSEVSVSYNGLLSQFDLLLVWANSDDYTEILPCKNIIQGGINFNYLNMSAQLNYYDNYKMVSITDTTMSSFRYFHVSGIKFT